MANHHLIQAICGPKPTTSFMDSDGKDDKRPDPRLADSESSPVLAQHDLDLQALRSLFSELNLRGTANASDSSTLRSCPAISAVEPHNYEPGQVSYVSAPSFAVAHHPEDAGNLYTLTPNTFPWTKELLDNVNHSESEKEKHMHPDRPMKNSASGEDLRAFMEKIHIILTSVRLGRLGR